MCIRDSHRLVRVSVIAVRTVYIRSYLIFRKSHICCPGRLVPKQIRTFFNDVFRHIHLLHHTVCKAVHLSLIHIYSSFQ